MDILLSDALPPAKSPYLTDSHDFTSPTPSSGQLNVSPNSPFDSFDFNGASPRIPLTPSYNGSYQGSPYTSYSELSYGAHDINEPLEPLFDGDEAHSLLRTDDYDPSTYDAPNHTSGLLMFNMDFLDGVEGSNPQLQLAVTPPADAPYDHQSPYDPSSPFEQSSPGSSNGAGNNRSSRASSVSSNHMGSPPTHKFEAMNFDNRAGWSSTGDDAALSPREKPQSPPRLVIAEPSSSASGAYPSPPMINAPDGEGGMGAGPALCVVPATPVSGGGAATAVPSFQQTLDTMHQQSGSSSLSWPQPTGAR